MEYRIICTLKLCTGYFLLLKNTIMPSIQKYRCNWRCSISLHHALNKYQHSMGIVVYNAASPRRQATRPTQIERWMGRDQTLAHLLTVAAFPRNSCLCTISCWQSSIGGDWWQRTNKAPEGWTLSKGFFEVLVKWLMQRLLVERINCCKAFMGEFKNHTFRPFSMS